MRLYKDILSKLVQSKLFITNEALQAELARIYAADISEIELPTYSSATNSLAKKLSAVGVNLTTNFRDTNIEENSIALHRIEGTIFSEYDYWGYYFSTFQFIDDLEAAEANDKITGHFVYINSGGGDAYYLDIAAAAFKNLTKPSMGFVREHMCSAALYLGIYLDKLYANTPFETIGAIGTMVAFWDIVPYFETLGFKWHEHYADQSKLKNKKYNDLLEGKPKQFIEDELNPLAAEFIRTVKDARPATASAPEEVFQGETYYTPKALEIGLIDGQMLIEDAIQELITTIDQQQETNINRKAILNLIN
ncbi:hypothetical protein ES705_24092 [subsurface metagenome]